MKLRKNNNNKKVLSNYTISISIAEAEEAGLIDKERNSYEVEKIVDKKNNQIIIKKV